MMDKVNVVSVVVYPQGSQTAFVEINACDFPEDVTLGVKHQDQMITIVVIRDQQVRPYCAFSDVDFTVTATTRQVFSREG